MPDLDLLAGSEQERKLQVHHTRGSTHDVRQPLEFQSAAATIGTRPIVDLNGAVVTDDSTNNKVSITVGVTTRALQARPSMAAGITLTSTTTAYLAGSWVEIVAANTITTVFYLAGIRGVTPNDQVEYIVQIGTGGAGSEVAVAEVGYNIQTAAAILSQTWMLPFLVQIAANTRVAGRVATSGTNARTLAVYVQTYENTL